MFNQDSGNGRLAVSYYGSEKVSIRDNGNVGIGTTSPTEKLEIEDGNLLINPSGSRSTAHNGLLLGFNRYSGGTQAGLYGASDGKVQNSDGNLYIAPRNINSGNGSYIQLGQRDSDTASHKGTVIITAGAYNTNSQTGDILLNYGTSDRVTLDGATGNVGIGTTSPLTNLHVANTGGAAQLSLERTDTSDTLKLVIGSSYGYLQNTTGPLSLGATGGSQQVYIATDGDVGIGTTSPNQKLTVSGSISINKNAEYLYAKTSTDSNVRMLGINSSDVAYVGPIDAGPVTTHFNASSTSTAAYFYTSGSIKMSIGSTGNVGIGTTSPSAKLDVNGGINVTQNSYINWGGGSRIVGQSSYLRLQTSSQDRISITNTGNVGIGTTSPSQKLEVRDGNILASGSNSKVALGTATGIPRIYSNANEDLLLATANQSGSVVYLQDSDGRVGIGTSSPQKKLTVAGAVSASAYYGDGSNLTGITTSDGLADILNNNNEAGGNAIDMGSGDITQVGEVQATTFNGTTASLAYVTSSGAGLHIDANVGIGTTSPDEKLHVAGNAKASNYYVASNIIHTGDVDTQIKFASNNIKFDTGGSQRLELSNDGTVKIGNSANNTYGLRFQRENSSVPQDSHFYSPTNNSPSAFFIEGGYWTGEAAGTVTAANSGYAYYERYFGNGSANSYKHFGFVNSTGAFTGTDMTASLALKSNGNVGIGTTSPSYQLDVNGSSRIKSNAQALTVQGTDHVYIGWSPAGSRKAYAGFPSAGSTSFTLMNENTGALYLGTNGSNYFVITSTGNVGIGTTSPSQKLHVHGNALINHRLDVYSDLRIRGNSSATGSGVVRFFTDGNNKLSIDAGNDGQNLFTFDSSGNLVVPGSVTAQEFHTEFVSASIIYESGSTKFGNTSDDIHSFTGSLQVLGSIDRPFTVTDGRAFHQGESGGWRLEYGFKGSSGTDRGGFGAQGANDTVTYYYIGSTQTSPTLAATPAGNVGIGTTSPSEALHVSGAMVIDSGSQATKLDSNRIAVSSTTTVIADIDPTTYVGAVIDYTAYNDDKTTGMRTGQLMLAFDESTNVTVSDVTTTDIGDTSGVTFTATNNGSSVRLSYNTPDTSWNIRLFRRLL